MSNTPSARPYRVRVAVPLFIYQLFDYTITADQFNQVYIGARVRVPFGSQQLVAIVLDKFNPQDEFESKFKLKPILELLDQQALLDSLSLSLLRWTAEYYQFPIGEVLHLGLPTLLRQGKPADLLTHKWKVLIHHTEQLPKLSIKQQQAYQILKLHPYGTTEDILNASGVLTVTLKALLNKKVVSCEIDQTTPHIQPVQLAQLPLTPNTDQQHAISNILKHQHHYHGFLLDGLTGSGKTEVYLQVMYEILKQGKQVLVLVPEIGLTPQTIARFQSRFCTSMTILHSGLTDAKRLQGWLQAQSGHARIILGTRSAIFTPLPNLGLIILDEEHDLSYKQQESLRYHARDVALYRGYLQQCPVILGSATPSIDSYHLVEQKKLTSLQLNQRAGSASLPQLHTIDLKIAPKQFGLSIQLITKIHATLQRGEQVLIFLNRRGFAPVLFCESCAWQADCPRCDAHFTVHTQPYTHLHCHHCGLIHTFPQHCPNCQAEHTLKPLGMGTAKVEQHLNSLFPQYPVLRVDRDSTHHIDSWDKFYEQILNNKPLILLGTQMLSKGHHFPFVTLVAILDIDTGFFSADFRAPERTAQQIIQVAGRAGRIHKKGEVYLQTLRPDHPMLSILLNHDYRYFVQHVLQERQLAYLPPYTYAVLVRVSSKQAEYNQQFLQHILQLFDAQQHNEQHKIDIWGPIPAPMAKKADYHFAHVLFFSEHRKYLHQHIHIWWQKVIKLPRQFQLKLILDIDPQEIG